MKKLTFFPVGILVVFILSPPWLLYAQTPAKPSLPQVPIAYPGDTDETIRRRAQWIEGAKKEGALDWWGIGLTLAESSKLISEFNKVYPFVKVNFWRTQGEEIAAKLEGEYSSGRYTADITLGGEPYNYARWRKMGMMGKFSDIIPRIENMDKRAYSRYGDWVQPGNNAIAPQYNTKLVSAAEAPKGWEDLLNPKWKGQIAITTDMKESIYCLT